jgi:hypothetical protein
MNIWRGENEWITYEKIHLYVGSVVVKALCYKPEGRGFDTL